MKGNALDSHSRFPDLFSILPPDTSSRILRAEEYPVLSPYMVMMTMIPQGRSQAPRRGARMELPGQVLGYSHCKVAVDSDCLLCCAPPLVTFLCGSPSDTRAQAPMGEAGFHGSGLDKVHPSMCLDSARGQMILHLAAFPVFLL